MSQGLQPALSTATVRQPTRNRAVNVRSGNLGSNVRNANPRINTSNLSPITRDNPRRTNPATSIAGTGNLVRNPLTGNGNVVRGQFGADGLVRNPLTGNGNAIRGEFGADGLVRDNPVTGGNGNATNGPPTTFGPGGVAGDIRVSVPSDIADGLPDQITPPANDEVGTAVDDLEPITPDVETVVPDEIGTAVDDLEPIDSSPVEAPVEEAPLPVDAGTVVGAVSDLISQFAGRAAGSDYGGGGYPVENATAVEVTPVAESIDIELTEVRLIEAGSVEHKVGPRFRLFCRNNGSVEAPKFHVSVLVDSGKELTEAAYLVTVESVGIKPGNTQSVDVQLPVEVLKMTTENDQWARPFETFGAFIDSDDSLAETDEDNNVLLLARAAITAVKRVAIK